MKGFADFYMSRALWAFEGIKEKGFLPLLSLVLDGCDGRRAGFYRVQILG